MGFVRVAGDDASDNKSSTAELFQLLWNDLVDVLGSSATATLLRRAAKHGVKRQPGLTKLVIHRPAFEYEYVVPEHWSTNGRQELVVLCQTLVPILEELTGRIVVQRLRSIPQLASLVDDQEGSAS
jgi:hypothetical protein